MPHYADGTPAQIGDKVKGKPYNTAHEVVGEIVSITIGSEVCNCEVVFVELSDPPSVLQSGDISFFAIRRLDGKFLAAKVKTDYGETRAFTKIL